MTKPQVERSERVSDRNRSENRSDRSEKNHSSRSSDQKTDQTDQKPSDQKNTPPIYIGGCSVAPPKPTRNRRSAKAAGTAFETLITRYLAQALNDDRIERRARNGRNDRGDVSGVRIHGQRLVLECKNHRRLDLPGWVAEAQLEAGNDDALAGLVVHKRHGTAKPERQWVTMTVAELVALLTGQRADD